LEPWGRIESISWSPITKSWQALLVPRDLFYVTLKGGAVICASVTNPAPIRQTLNHVKAHVVRPSEPTT
jgi:hypothetical protein